jgi:hypothetical protein
MAARRFRGAHGTNSGTGCRQGVTFLRRCGGSTFQSGMVMAFGRWNSPGVTLSQSWSRRFMPTPTATGRANLRSTPCAQRESAAGATTGCSILTSKPTSTVLIGPICHCKSAEEAPEPWRALVDRFTACQLVLHPEKTKIVYCRDANRRGDFPRHCVRLSGFSVSSPEDDVEEGREAHLRAQLSTCGQSDGFKACGMISRAPFLRR